MLQPHLHPAERTSPVCRLLTFDNCFSMQATPTAGVNGYDPGMLEIYQGNRLAGNAGVHIHGGPHRFLHHELVIRRRHVGPRRQPAHRQLNATEGAGADRVPQRMTPFYHPGGSPAVSCAQPMTSRLFEIDRFRLANRLNPVLMHVVFNLQKFCDPTIGASGACSGCRRQS
jgi:hypothetical protein